MGDNEEDEDSRPTRSHQADDEDEGKAEAYEGAEVYEEEEEEEEEEEAYPGANSAAPQDEVGKEEAPVEPQRGRFYGHDDRGGGRGRGGGVRRDTKKKEESLWSHDKFAELCAEDDAKRAARDARRAAEGKGGGKGDGGKGGKGGKRGNGKGEGKGKGEGRGGGQGRNRQAAGERGGPPDATAMHSGVPDADDGYGGAQFGTTAPYVFATTSPVAPLVFATTAGTVDQRGQSAPWAAPQLGSCASSGRAWRLWAGRLSQEEAGPLGAQPLPRMLERAASIAADFTAFGHSGTSRSS